jgi:hypothetical protein
MHRIFLGLAVTDGSLLLASLVLGFLAVGEARPQEHAWRDVHFLLGLLTTMTTLLVHSIVFTYFLGTGRWVKEVAYVYRLPEWVHAQAVRNKRRAFPFELWGMVTIGVAAWLGAGSDARGWPSWWHLTAASVALAFNLGAFVAEYASIVAQARLLLEVKDQADRLRLAQQRAKEEAALSDPAPVLDPARPLDPS